MNKKANTVLFILGATLFNILVTIISFLLLLTVYAKLIMPHLPEAAQTAQAWSVVLIIIAAMAISFVAYRFAMKILLKKIQIDKYFDPIFGGRHRLPR